MNLAQIIKEKQRISIKQEKSRKLSSSIMKRRTSLAARGINLETIIGEDEPEEYT